MFVKIKGKIPKGHWYANAQGITFEVHNTDDERPFVYTLTSDVRTILRDHCTVVGSNKDSKKKKSIIGKLYNIKDYSYMDELNPNPVKPDFGKDVEILSEPFQCKIKSGNKWQYPFNKTGFILIKYYNQVLRVIYNPDWVKENKPVLTAKEKYHQAALNTAALYRQDLYSSSDCEFCKITLEYRSNPAEGNCKYCPMANNEVPGCIEFKSYKSGKSNPDLRAYFHENILAPRILNEYPEDHKDFRGFDWDHNL